MAESPTFNELLSTNSFPTYVAAVEAHASLASEVRTTPTLKVTFDDFEGSTIEPEFAQKVLRDFGNRAIAAANKIVNQSEQN